MKINGKVTALPVRMMRLSRVYEREESAEESNVVLERIWRGGWCAVSQLVVRPGLLAGAVLRGLPSTVQALFACCICPVSLGAL
jgi:hypothetical protein